MNSIDEFNKRKITHEDFYFVLLSNINLFYSENGSVCQILFYLHLGL